MKQNFDIPGCTGCGRCIDTCPANIEFREVIDNVSNHKQVQAEQISSRSEMEVEA
jgi:ferredoxin